MSADSVPEARPDDVRMTLRWRADRGHLVGDLEAKNVCNHPVRLSNKPTLEPIGTDGKPLDTETIVSLEMRLPGYAEIAPGETARTQVMWGGWDGPPASGRWIVAWQGGSIEVTAQGPLQPESTGPATNLSSTWFERAD